MKELELVLSGTETQIDLPSNVTPSDVVNHMESLGYDYDMDTNGWQHDFWIRFSKVGSQSYEYSGCWWDGSQSFSMDVDEIDEEPEEEYDPYQDPSYIMMMEGKRETSENIKNLCEKLGIDPNDKITVDEFDAELDELEKEDD